MHRILFLPLILCFSAITSLAQYSQVGDGLFASISFGPFISSTTPGYYSRNAFIYPFGALANLNHGDSITALMFQYAPGDTLAGPCNLKVYLKNTRDPDFGIAQFNWLATMRDGMELVYDGDPRALVNQGSGSMTIAFNQVDAWGYDTLGKGRNLQILIQYTQNTSQSATLPFYNESGTSVPSFISSNEAKYLSGASAGGLDSIATFNSIVKPTLRVYHPSDSIELEARKLYNLGKVPLLMQRPDTIKLLVQNIGKYAAVNHPVYLDIASANTFKDTLFIDSIAPLETQMVYFYSHQPANQGTEVVQASLGADGNTQNNTAMRIREVSYNIFSHYDYTLPSNGSIGFGDTSGDFVAKYYVNGSRVINQISVDFGLANRPFQLGIWKDDRDGGLPGSLIYMSDTLTSTTGTFILAVDPHVTVNGGFYVGIRQSTSAFVGFTFQYERPIRPHSFYFAGPASDTNWVPFAPGYDYNFNIQPRLQVGNDLSVLDVLNPQQNDTFRYHPTDSLPLTARVVNEGYFNQGLFNVTMDILTEFNQVLQRSVKTISLNAGDTATVQFDKLSLYNIGKFRARAYVSLSTDSVPDNDQKEVEFYLVKDHDVAVDIVYEPSNNDTFEINDEGFWPNIRVINYGVQPQNDIPVVIELVNNQGIVVSQQSTTTSLGPSQSEIITFDSMFLAVNGRYVFRAYTNLAWDSFPINDTTSVNIVGWKSHDVSILKVLTPKDSSLHTLGTSFKPFVEYRNEGFVDEDSTFFYLAIRNANNAVVYTDTLMKSLPLFSTGQIQFKRFECNKVGDYTIEVQCWTAKDQLRSNDTLTSHFSVKTGYDLQIVDLLTPKGSLRNKDSMVYPALIVNNFGLNDAVQVPFVLNFVNQLNQEKYRDTLRVDLASFSQDTFVFNKGFSLNETGNYYVEVFHTWASESSPSSDDTLITQFSIRYATDLRVSRHIKPANKDTLEYFESAVAKLQLINTGLDTCFDVLVALQYSSLGDTVYRDTLSLPFLASSTAFDLTSLTSWQGGAGVYQFESKVISADDNSANNLFSTTFYVVIRKDLSVVQLVYPEENQRLRINRKYQPSAVISNRGMEDYSNALVTCNLYVDGQKEYSRSAMVDLASGSDTTMALDSNLSYDKVSIGTIEWVVSGFEDQESSNDTLRYTVEFVDGASIVSLKKGQISLYPNPNTGSIVLSSLVDLQRIVISDQQGKRIVQRELSGNTASISWDAAPGVYTVKVYTSEGVWSTKVVRIH